MSAVYIYQENKYYELTLPDRTVLVQVEKVLSEGIEVSVLRDTATSAPIFAFDISSSTLGITKEESFSYVGMRVAISNLSIIAVRPIDEIDLPLELVK